MHFTVISPIQDFVRHLDERMMTLQSNLSVDILSIEGQVRKNNDKLENLDAELVSTKYMAFQNQLNLSSLSVSVRWSRCLISYLSNNSFSAECLFVKK